MAVYRIPYDKIARVLGRTLLGILVEAARGALCNLYNNSPSWATADPLGMGAFNQALWNAICPADPPRPPIPPAQPPVLGGRCECVEYRIEVERQSQGVRQSNAVFNVFGPVVVRGWVAGLNPGAYDFRIDHGAPQCRGATFTNIYANVVKKDIRRDYTWAQVVSITRLDGREDNCGNQPPIYEPQVPDINLLNLIVPITVSPEFTIPVGFYYVKPGLDIDVNGNIAINLSPSFNIDLAPDIDINIGFDFNGVNININPRGGGPGAPPPRLPPPSSPDPRPNPPRLPPNVNNSDCDCGEIERLLKDAIKRIEELEECACPSFDGLRAVRIIQGNSGIAPLPEEARWVRVVISQLPGNARSWNGLQAPSPVTAGWAWFDFEGGEAMADRHPLDAMRKAFPVPRGARKFAYTIYSGGNGFAEAFVP